MLINDFYNLYAPNENKESVSFKEIEELKKNLEQTSNYFSNSFLLIINSVKIDKKYMQDMFKNIKGLKMKKKDIEKQIGMLVSNPNTKVIFCFFKNYNN